MTAKLAVRVPEQFVARARHAVAQGRAASVSAYVADALQQKSNLDDLESMLEQMLAGNGGPLTDAETLAADKVLGVGNKTPRSAA